MKITAAEMIKKYRWLKELNIDVHINYLKIYGIWERRKGWKFDESSLD
jgi:hypothetical protein